MSVLIIWNPSLIHIISSKRNFDRTNVEWYGMVRLYTQKCWTWAETSYKLLFPITMTWRAYLPYLIQPFRHPCFMYRYVILSSYAKLNSVKMLKVKIHNDITEYTIKYPSFIVFYQYLTSFGWQRKKKRLGKCISREMRRNFRLYQKVHFERITYWKCWDEYTGGGIHKWM